MIEFSSTRARDELARLEDNQLRMIGLVEAWAAVNSGSLELAGLSRMASEIEVRLADLPATPRRVALPDTERVRADGTREKLPLGEALELRVRPDAPLQVALTGHYDTVFPAAHPFQTVRRTANGSLLNGPGTADMKGGLIVMLEALSAFERTNERDRLGYTVLISPDEEIGSPGSAPLLATLGASAHVGMTYEPAMLDGALAGARKGSGNYALVITGRAAHVGRAFADGRSAMVAAADAVLRLDALNGRRPGVTVNIGAVDGGGPVNVVPAGAVVRFNVRMADDEERAWAEAEIARVVEAVSARDGVAAVLHGAISRPPKPMTPAQTELFSWVKAAGAELGLDLEWRPTGGVCEGNNLLAAGCPNVDTLGVRGANLHSADEVAAIDSFAERAKLSFLLLCGFASGAFDVRKLTA